MHNTLVGLNLRDRIRIGAAGKIISAFDIARTMALGADWCNAARGFMFALGCIQAQTLPHRPLPDRRDHAGPAAPAGAGGARQGRARATSFHQNTLKALQELVQAAGPATIRAQITAHAHRAPHHRPRGALLANLLPFVQPGALLRGEMPHRGVPAVLADGAARHSFARGALTGEQPRTRGDAAPPDALEEFLRHLSSRA